MKAGFSIGAAILTAYFLIAGGAPAWPVALGIAAALIWTLRERFSGVFRK